ncbi:Fe-Mn family superoxide dismutase [Streptosporangium sp. NPDC049248]|uniref:Fe-Mn family superoxide dismutase n=1 Tax=Streptosporangium sp. NPDC049248 TaxID=3155651 RepID=UPI00342A2ECA
MQGSSWGVLAWEPFGRRLVVEQVYDHHGNVGMNTTPLLVFDAWEHAYYLQYRNVRPDYVEKLWSLINWNDVIACFDAARELYKLALCEHTLTVKAETSSGASFEQSLKFIGGGEVVDGALKRGIDLRHGFTTSGLGLTAWLRPAFRQ